MTAHNPALRSISGIDFRGTIWWAGFGFSASAARAIVYDDHTAGGAGRLARSLRLAERFASMNHIGSVRVTAPPAPALAALAAAGGGA